MSTDASQPSLRFIKKVPSSGGSPAYKLTLPHQIVNRRLQHLVDTGFELASSPTSAQTWHGSIAPRRNKDRNEYILQGWKLFAEAHNFQAGDQISFELIGERRLVVKCIQAAGNEKPYHAARNQSERPKLTDEQPSKSLRLHASSSPSRQQVSQATNSFHDGDRVVPCNPASSDAVKAPCFSSPPNLPVNTSPMVQRVQSWLSLKLPSSNNIIKKDSSQPPYSPRPSYMLEDTEVKALQHTASISTEDPDSFHEPYIEDMHVDLPGIFEDMGQDFDSIVPDIPTNSRMELGGEPGLGSFSSSLDNTQFKQAALQMSEVQSHEKDLRALVSRIQDRLDQSTRTALRATMGLEHCAMDIVTTAAQNQPRDVQARMFGHLSSLKESLWQVLVIANDAKVSDLP